jgi:periplasmic copper chaperone A
MTNYFLKGMTTALLLSLLACQPQGAIEIIDPWIREAPPTAKALAAFMLIENRSDKPRTLISANCSAFEKVEIHKSFQRDGMMQMEQQHELVIPANGQKRLAPGGYHLMLMRPKQPLKAGDQIDVTLQFANGEKLSITAPVKSQL